jgi:hypothetical protein
LRSNRERLEIGDWRGEDGDDTGGAEGVGGCGGQLSSVAEQGKSRVMKYGRLALIVVLVLVAACQLGPASTLNPSPTATANAPTASAPTKTPTSIPPAAAPTSVSTASASSAWNVELVSRAGGKPLDVSIRDSYVYVGAGSTLVVLDVRDPSHPTQVGLASLPVTGISCIYIVESYAIVAARDGDLWVVDISNPTVPAVISSYQTPGEIIDVVADGDYAYVLNYSEGLRVLDISNPETPVEIGFYASPWHGDGIALVGDFVYISSSSRGLAVVDISDPTVPVEIGSYDPAEADALVLDVVAIEDYAYVFTNDHKLRVVDVSDPAMPIEVGSYEEPSLWFDALSVAGRYIYAVDRVDGLVILDASNPTSPTAIGGVWLFEAHAVAVEGNYACVADWEGLHVVDVSDPIAPTEVGFYDTLAPGHAVAVSDGYAYIAEGEDGPVGLEWGSLGVVDVSQPISPAVVGSYDTCRIATDIVVAGNIAYVTDGECEFGAAACWGDMRIMDVSNPAIPTQLGIYSLTDIEAEWPVNRSWFGSGVAVLGDYAYVTGGTYYSPQPGGEHGLRVMDVSNPITPTTVGVMKAEADVVPWAGHGVTVVGHYAYVAAGDSGLRVIDVSDPTSPIEVGFCEVPGMVQDVEVVGGYAYVAASSADLRVIDVSDPTAPAEVGSYGATGSAWDVAVSGSHVYIAADMGLRVVDVSDPAFPTEVGFYDTGHAEGVAVADGYVYVVGSGGLFILKVVSFRE